MVDVGFGGDGATKPLPMIRYPPAIVHNIGTQDIRLLYDTIPQLSASYNSNIDTKQEDQDKISNSKLWIYQYRNGPNLPWNAFYSFPEIEFLPADFDIMNYYVSNHPASFQTFTVLVVKFLRGGNVGNGRAVKQVHDKPARTENKEEGEEVVAQVMNNGVTTKCESEGVDDEETIYGKRMLVNDLVKENLGGKTQVVRVLQREEDRVKALEKFFGIRLMREEREGIRGRKEELKGEREEVK